MKYNLSFVLSHLFPRLLSLPIHILSGNYMNRYISNPIFLGSPLVQLEICQKVFLSITLLVWFLELQLKLYRVLLLLCTQLLGYIHIPVHSLLQFKNVLEYCSMFFEHINPTLIMRVLILKMRWHIKLSFLLLPIQVSLTTKIGQVLFVLLEVSILLLLVQFCPIGKQNLSYMWMLFCLKMRLRPYYVYDMIRMLGFLILVLSVLNMPSQSFPTGITGMEKFPQIGIHRLLLRDGAREIETVSLSLPIRSSCTKRHSLLLISTTLLDSFCLSSISMDALSIWMDMKRSERDWRILRSALRAMLTTSTQMLCIIRFLFPSRLFRLEILPLWTTSNKDRILLLLGWLQQTRIRRRRSSIVPFDWWEKKGNHVSLTIQSHIVRLMVILQLCFLISLSIQSLLQLVKAMIWPLYSTMIDMNGLMKWLWNYTICKTLSNLASLCWRLGMEMMSGQLYLLSLIFLGLRRARHKLFTSKTTRHIINIVSRTLRLVIVLIAFGNWILWTWVLY